MRLIDIDGEYKIEVTIEGDTCTAFISAASTVDAVPVVRCKDCKYYQNSVGNCDDDACPISYQCDRLNKHMFESDYCSFGERKEGTPL